MGFFVMIKTFKQMPNVLYICISYDSMLNIPNFIFLYNTEFFQKI